MAIAILRTLNMEYNSLRKLDGNPLPGAASAINIPPEFDRIKPAGGGELSLKFQFALEHHLRGIEVLRNAKPADLRMNSIRPSLLLISAESGNI